MALTVFPPPPHRGAPLAPAATTVVALTVFPQTPPSSRSLCSCRHNRRCAHPDSVAVFVVAFTLISSLSPLWR